jgi:hypothetical protein
MWGYPGKKLLFMGQEFAPAPGMDEGRPLDWDCVDAPAHAGCAGWCATCNGFIGKSRLFTPGIARARLRLGGRGRQAQFRFRLDRMHPGANRRSWS